MTHDHATDLKDPLYAWVMVATTFVLTGLAIGALSSVSVFLKPLASEFGWTRSEASLGYTAVTCASAVAGLVWGYFADRFGGRWIGMFGAVAMALCLYAMSLTDSLADFYVFYLLYGALGMGAISAPLMANVGFWFRRNPGLAIGIAAAGGAVGQGIVPYFATLAIGAYGWQTAYELIGFAYLAISLPMALLIRDAPDRTRARTTPTIAAHRDFPVSEKEVVVWISIAIIFCCNCMSVPVVHLVPLLTDQGHTPTSAATVLFVLMAAGGFGRIFGGRLCDLIGAVPAYLVMSIGQTVLVVWFPQLSALGSHYVLAVLFGFTYSGVMSAVLVSTRMLIGAGFAARAMSIVSFFGWLGMGMGGFLGGLYYDMSGHYAWSFGFAGAAGVVNIMVLVAFLIRIQRARAGRQAAHAM